MERDGETGIASSRGIIRLLIGFDEIPRYEADGCMSCVLALVYNINTVRFVGVDGMFSFLLWGRRRLGYMAEGLIMCNCIWYT